MSSLQKAFDHPLNRYVIGGREYFRASVGLQHFLIPVLSQWQMLDEEHLYEFSDAKKSDDELRKFIAYCLPLRRMRMGDAGTLLHLCAAARYPGCVRLLLGHGADPNSKDQFGDTPIDRTQSEEIKKILRKAGGKPSVHPPDVARRCDFEKMWKSVIDKDISGVKKFVEKFGMSQIHVQGEYDDALTLSVRLGAYDIASYLLDQGADPNVRRWDMVTPLFDAVDFGHARMIHLLARHGADMNAVGINGWTALMYTASRGGSAAAMGALLYNKADITIANDEGETAADLARGSNRPGLFKATFKAVTVKMAARVPQEGLPSRVKPHPRIHVRRRTP